MQRIYNDQKPTEEEEEAVLALDQRDRSWVTTVIKRSRSLYMDEQDPVEAELEVHLGENWKLQAKRRTHMSYAVRLYPVDLTWAIPPELMERIMHRVRTNTAVSQGPPQCGAFCKSLMLREMAANRRFKVEPHISETICTLVLAAIGCHEEGGQRSRAVHAVGNTLGPMVTDGFVGVCCRAL